MRITFQQCKTWRKKSGRCVACGKRTTRSKTFINTVNPWNVNVAGQMKTVPEVYQDLNREADAWYAEDLTCAACGREGGKG